jgi:hypothetical protein
MRSDRVRARIKWLGAVRRLWGSGWGAVLVSMGGDYSAREWASMTGLDEQAIRWILLERREDLESE